MVPKKGAKKLARFCRFPHQRAAKNGPKKLVKLVPKTDKLSCIPPEGTPCMPWFEQANLQKVNIEKCGAWTT